MTGSSAQVAEPPLAPTPSAPAESLQVYVTDEQTAAVPNAAHIEALCRHVLRGAGGEEADGGAPAGSTEVNVTFVDAPTMTQLNETHMGKAGPTDVLAFPIDQPGNGLAGPTLLGDVVVCPAAADGQSIDLLVVHGLLHLLGMDHATEPEATAMFGLQSHLLGSFAATVGEAGGSAS